MEHVKLMKSLNYILNEMPDSGKNKNTFPFLALFLGIITGAITALLYTPDSGENNRKKIADKFNGDSNNKSGNLKIDTSKDTFMVQDIADEESMHNLELLKEKLKS